MIKLSWFTYPTDIGPVNIQVAGDAVVAITIGRAKMQGEKKSTRLSNAAANQIQQYLAGKRRVFDIPVAPDGSDFVKLVWDYLQTIPYGQTRSYSHVAAAIGHPNSARAVGTACKSNPIPILIPCHRVVRANADIGEYSAGKGRATKAYLLELEAKHAE